MTRHESSATPAIRVERASGVIVGNRAKEMDCDSLARENPLPASPVRATGPSSRKETPKRLHAFAASPHPSIRHPNPTGPVNPRSQTVEASRGSVSCARENR